MTRFKIGDRVVVVSPVKEEHKGRTGEVVAVDVVKWEADKTIESYTIQFPDLSHETFLGAALVLQRYVQP
jgi:hypothetical protein